MPTIPSPTIKEAQEAVDAWIKKFGKRYFNELTNTAILTEEVGELARLMAREFGEQSYKPGREPEDPKKEIAEELADILFISLCLANQMDIDLTEAFKAGIEKRTNRDETRHLKNEKLA